MLRWPYPSGHPKGIGSCECLSDQDGAIQTLPAHSQRRPLIGLSLFSLRVLLAQFNQCLLSVAGRRPAFSFHPSATKEVLSRFSGNTLRPAFQQETRRMPQSEATDVLSVWPQPFGDLVAVNAASWQLH